MATKFDARQVISRDVLSQLVNATGTELDDVLRAIDSELTLPLALTESSPADRVLNIDAITVTNPATGRVRSITPIDGTIPTFSSGTVTLSATGAGTATPSAGSAINLSMSASQFLKIGINLDSSGNIVLEAGTPGASEAAATAPALVVDTHAIGYIVVETDGSNNVQNITASDIFQYVGSGGGGGSAGGSATINYITNPDFEDDVTTGVTPTNLTSAAETSAPLIGTQSHKLTSQSSTGECKYSITGIDNHIVDGGYKLSVYGRYKTDSNAATGDWTVGIWNNTDNAYVDGPNDLPTNTNGRFELGFVPLSGKTYSLRIEFTDTTASRVLLVDDLKCSNDPLPESPIIGNVQTTSPTYNSESGITWARNNLTYARVGDSLHVNGLVYVSNGSGVAADFTLPLPTINGQTITATAGNFGEATLIWGNNDDITGYLTGDGTSNVKFTFGGTVLQGSDFGTPGGGSQEGMRYSAMIPISEWAGTGTTVTVADTTAKTKVITPTFSSTPAGWTLAHSSMQGFRDSDGNYSAYVNFKASVTSTNNAQVVIDGTPSVGFDPQALTMTGDSLGNAGFAFTGPEGSTATRIFRYATSNITTFGVSGIIRLSGKPDWWDANVENSKDVSVEILEATDTTLGLVKKNQYVTYSSSSGYTTTQSIHTKSNIPAGLYWVTIGAREVRTNTTSGSAALLFGKLNGTIISIPTFDDYLQVGTENLNGGLTAIEASALVEFPNATNTFELSVSIASGSIAQPHFRLVRLQDYVDVGSAWD